MTTKKIIFAAALLAGTMTTSWAGSSEASVTVTGYSVVAAVAGTNSTDIQFNKIFLWNCAEYHNIDGQFPHSYSNKKNFVITVATNQSTSTLTIDYNGVLADTETDEDPVAYRLYYFDNADTVSTGSILADDTEIQLNGAGNAVSNPKRQGVPISPQVNHARYQIKGYAKITQANLCTVFAAERAGSITATAATV